MPEVLEPAKELTDEEKSEPVPQKTGIQNTARKWRYLPYEIWIIILVEYGLESEDLLMLEKCCKWFSLTWTSAGIVIIIVITFASLVHVKCARVLYCYRFLCFLQEFLPSRKKVLG